MPHWLESHPALPLSAIAIIAFIESFALVGVLVPGVVLLFSLAALVSQLDIPIHWALLSAATGACAGDISSFLIGRRVADRLHQIAWFQRHQVWLEQGEWFFRRWGWLSVIIGRFVGPIRPVVPLIAGTLHMPKRLFIGLNLVSVMAWAPIYILPGYFTIEVAHLVETHSLAERTLFITAVAVLCLLLVVLTINHHLHPEHPKTARWLPIMKRIPPSFPFSALTLAVVAVISLACLIWARPLQWDLLLSQQVPAWRVTSADHFVVGFTILGDPVILTLASILITAWLFLKGYYWLAAHLLVALATTLIGLLVLKALFDVDRPDWVAQQPVGDAFPSGHSTGFALFVGILAAFLNEARPAVLRWQWYLPAGLLMCAMAFSRVWLGVHWLSDVIAGLLLALLLAALTRISYTSLTRKRFSPPRSSAFWGLLVLTFAAYVIVAWDGAQLDYQLMH